MCQPINPIEKFRNEGMLYSFEKHRLVTQSGQMPYPIALSSLQLGEKYPPIGNELNREKLFLAQQLARFARQCKTDKARDRYNNLANYQLTAAYEGGDRHERFWAQM
ncbi:hypothetical protein DIBBI_gp44 [Xanthomonas phage vB_XveM_DIBBI]|uniref:Uncharacterized protein n=1 Tax=Xanthomonas phage vB_XveM_DIBBI TaxID=1129194 RepID=I3PGX7_9CAUD|nr:hypothetical protein DIBBI_gp44 [Xanthomonas phage vB_XveM_DIBBI]AEX65712.1 hypothetical protein DIBBI_044 [Xanthomonas phage vB_XveM_DIBBI]